MTNAATVSAAQPNPTASNRGLEQNVLETNTTALYKTAMAISSGVSASRTKMPKAPRVAIAGSQRFTGKVGSGVDRLIVISTPCHQKLARICVRPKGPSCQKPGGIATYCDPGDHCNYTRQPLASDGWMIWRGSMTIAMGATPWR
jgi:hypothetical protein